MQDKRLKTLVLSVVLSAFGPLVLMVAMFMNTAATQVADFVRRTAELGVLILALWMYKKLSNPLKRSFKRRYESTMYYASASVLSFSALFLTVIIILDILNPSVPEGNVLLGLTVAVLGAVVNSFFFVRYTLFNKERSSAIMDSQGNIYQAKLIVDVNVMIALASVLIFQEGWIGYWIDLTGTAVIVIYLLIRSATLFKKGKLT